MGNVQILDCTLRDGGYVNDFRFGKRVIADIIEKLSKGNIDIVECGFLVSGADDANKSLFGSVEAIKSVLKQKNKNTIYVGMIQYGHIRNEEISVYDGTSIDGIRVTFHEHEIEEAFILGKQLLNKGYKVFMQPVGTTTYKDEALIQLITRVNELKPFAFYMVDTLGTMYKKDLLRMFYLIDHNLDEKIAVGFHSHNNLQLAFSNAQELLQINTSRRLILDATVYGMGRGAGNLCTELITQYINDNIEWKYNNLEVLEIIDEYIKPISKQFTWGYEAAHYISSICQCHPNYALYLLDKQTLHVQDIYAILRSIDEDHKTLYDKKNMEERYLNYMNHAVKDDEALEQIAQQINGKEILLLAPGKSLEKNKDKIAKMIETRKYFVISVNFIPKDLAVDMTFVGNIKRYHQIKSDIENVIENKNLVITSNIESQAKEKVLVVNYSSCLNDDACIMDNTGFMCINLLQRIGVDKIYLAGFDGFQNKIVDNYFDASMYMDVHDEQLMQVNDAISKKVAQLSNVMELVFVTDSVYYRER